MTPEEIRAELAQVGWQIEADMHAALGTIRPLHMCAYSNLLRRIAAMRERNADLHLELMLALEPLTPEWFSAAYATVAANMTVGPWRFHAAETLRKAIEQLEALENTP